ncbi:MAG TPA: hypothetical protein VD907_05575 [Verrucomicrobiae bacterium]|nr:hypothetical protein [Verrucomicrobiae bacterium]
MDNNQQISDDQELAKVLSGTNKKSPVKDLDDLDFEESPLPTPTVVTPPKTGETPANQPAPAAATPAQPAAANGKPATSPAPSTPTSATNLDAIKREALEQLRPLAPKLNLPAEEKFDTLLLIIRSTDDQSLLGAAHEAAKAIKDESRRAQALLDVIKEIDYFSSAPQQAA